DSVASGRGTSSLTISGVEVNISSQLTASAVRLESVASWNSAALNGSPYMARVLPGPYLFGYWSYSITQSSSVFAGMEFVVSPAGTLELAPEYALLAIVSGGDSLSVNGLAVGFDMRQLTGTSSFSINSVGTYGTSAVVSARLLPGQHSLSAIGINFDFTVSGSGTMSFDPSLNTTLSGNGTSTITYGVATQPPVFEEASCFLGGEVLAGVTTTLNACIALDPDGLDVTYTWSFSDGGTASGFSVDHVFGTGGGHSVTLTATNSAGRSSSITRGISALDGSAMMEGAMEIVRQAIAGGEMDSREGRLLLKDLLVLQTGLAQYDGSQKSKIGRKYFDIMDRLKQVVINGDTGGNKKLMIIRAVVLTVSAVLSGDPTILAKAVEADLDALEASGAINSGTAADLRAASGLVTLYTGNYQVGSTWTEAVRFNDIVAQGILGGTIRSDLGAMLQSQMKGVVKNVAPGSALAILEAVKTALPGWLSEGLIRRGLEKNLERKVTRAIRNLFHGQAGKAEIRLMHALRRLERARETRITDELREHLNGEISEALALIQD
ncbi:MAG: PKD domain-containing protein, partial [Bdellovibrionales bacterium]|nr:PKD domain-containing protein [Bdellovibrionales bacterium]